MSYDDDYDDEEIRQLLAEEVSALTRSQLRVMKKSRQARESWIYRTARSIARIISAPFRWIADAIRGFFDGLFGWLED
jgi:hypothetical protein